MSYARIISDKIQKKQLYALLPFLPFLSSFFSSSSYFFQFAFSSFNLLFFLLVIINFFSSLSLLQISKTRLTPCNNIQCSKSEVKIVCSANGFHACAKSYTQCLSPNGTPLLYFAFYHQHFRRRKE